MELHSSQINKKCETDVGKRIGSYAKDPEAYARSLLSSLTLMIEMPSSAAVPCRECMPIQNLRKPFFPPAVFFDNQLNTLYSQTMTRWIDSCNIAFSVSLCKIKY